MIRRPPRSTLSSSSAASDVYKRQPYGDRAVECLKSAGLLEKVNDKIVYADNISQTAQFAQTGNAEVGFLAYSLTLSPEMKGSTFEIDAKSYKPVAQAMAIVK